MIRRLTTGLLFFTIFTFGLSGIVYSEDVASPSSRVKVIDVSYEKVNPSNGMPYLFKRIREKINLFFSFSKKNKVQNYTSQVNTRLAELKYIIEKKEMGYFEQSTKRYFSTAGQLTSFLTKSKFKDGFTSVKEVFNSHIPVLTKLRDSYDPGTAEWRFVEDDINYLKKYINNLSTE